MIVLSEQTSSQQNMEEWFAQIEQPEFPLAKQGILQALRPKFVSCDFERRTLTLSCTVQQWQKNPGGVLHGGMIVSGFDVSFALLSHYFAKQHMISTIDINTTFLKPILPEDTIFYNVTLTRVGNTIYHLTGEAILERDNILAATASSCFMRLHQKFAECI